jgi:hypothetical protein
MPLADVTPLFLCLGVGEPVTRWRKMLLSSIQVASGEHRLVQVQAAVT